MCDGLRASLGSLTWPVLQHHLESVITVSEEEVKSSMKLLWER
jgi:threonine dehydratase